MSPMIRAAKLSDAAQIADLLQEIDWFSAIKNETAAVIQERVARHLARCLANDDHTVYVAEGVGGLIVGYASVHWQPYLFLAGMEGFLSELFIRTNERGKGIGNSLLTAVEQEAISRGCARLSLLNARHRESYERHFYEKQGWEERPVMANFVRYLPKKES